MERIPSDAPRTGSAERKPRSAAQSTQKIQLRDITYLLLSNWKWFLLSLSLCIGIAWLINKTTQPIYKRTASILIKDKEAMQEDVNGIIQTLGNASSVSLANELFTFKTVAIAQEITNRLHLDINYWRDNTFHKEVVYGIELPAEISFDSVDDDIAVYMTMTVHPDSSVTLSNMKFNGIPVENSVSVRFGTKVKTPAGIISVNGTPSYRHRADRIEVERIPMSAAVASVCSRINAKKSNNASVIDISYTDPSAARAEDVLNTLICVYNENWVKDRNQRTVSTNEFIKDRLAIIEQELGNVEQDISDYKSQHLMTSVEAVGSIALGQATSAEQQGTEIDNQIYMVRYMRDFLTQGVHENELLPSNTGINNPTVEGQITRYNELLMRRNSHLANSSLQNPLVKDLDKDLSVIRTTILKGLDNEMTKLNRLKKSVQSTYGQAVAKVAANPGSAKYLLSVERQQKVKESLYLFLLQKREENELSRAFTAYNNQLIEPPHGSSKPIEPKPEGSMITAIALGFLIPAVIIFGREFTNTNVRGRKDLENISVPMLGELPQHGKITRKNSGHSSRRKRHKKTPVPEILVKQGSRDVINEAFRVMRTNLELMLGFNDRHHVIMLTSMNPGSGKTFISANLSTIMATLNKRVLAIDLDLRKGSLSRYIGNPREGLCSYLTERIDDYRGVIRRLGDVDVLPCGKLPPNPSELLLSNRFANMMEELKKEYDYIFLDCPPVEIVADASIINRYADRTIFVIRANLLDRDALPDIQKWYDENRFNGLCMILNGTTDAFSHYGHHRYGSRYGYHYGKYGYGYGETEYTEPEN